MPYKEGALIRDFGKRIFCIDGGMGTMIQKNRPDFQGAPEVLNIEDPELIYSIHRAYVEAGADIIETNTFGANRIKLSNYNLSDKAYELNFKAAQLARRAAGSSVIVAGSVGPLGKFLKPVGEVDFSEAVSVFREQIRGLKDGGADVIFVETMSDLREAKAAIIAAKQEELPVFCMMTFQDDGRTLLGVTPEAAAVTLEAMGVVAIGANCSVGPDMMLQVAERMASVTHKPLVFMPNAGLPQLVDGKTVFPLKPEEFVYYVERFIETGAWFLGGCCGTTPEHIRKLKNILSGKIPVRRVKIDALKVAGRDTVVFIGDKFYPVVVGERINPTGKKTFQDDLVRGKTSWATKAAVSQKEHGADILDVNVGMGGINEEEMLPLTVSAVQVATGLPVMVDSSNTAAIEAALQVADGKPIINSTTAERKKLDIILPLAVKYGASVVLLPMDERGIPASPEKRFELVEKAAAVSEEYGFSPDEFLVDCIVMAVSAERFAAKVTLETLRIVKSKGCKTLLGISNVSFGLPQRTLLNSSFLSAAIIMGLDAAIINPENRRVMDAFYASCVLAGRDQEAKKYISLFSSKGVDVGSETKVVATPEEELKNAVITGDEEEARRLTEHLLKEKDALEIINKILIPAMEEVGKRYETGEYFLPQLIAAAKAMKAAFSVIKSSTNKKVQRTRGKIVLATVEGDIHDIGKNIVAMLLENHGFQVIDLGKNVPKERIVEVALKEKPDAVGLSALMTTTMMEMKNVIEELKRHGIKVFTIVGGAVVTPEFARSIGADFYAKDAVEAVKIMEKIVEGRV